MNQLCVSPGSGRLSRSGRMVIFSLEPDAELHQLRPQPGGDIFKTLATLIVARDFGLPSFAAIDLESRRLFLFGDIEVKVDADNLSAAESATWTEHRFEPGVVVMTAGMDGSSTDTDLVEGCVPASGFGLNMNAYDPTVIECDIDEAAPADPPDPYDDPNDPFDGDETEEPDLLVDATTPIGQNAGDVARHERDESAHEEADPDDVERADPGSGSRFRAPPPVTALSADSDEPADSPDASSVHSSPVAQLRCGAETATVGQGLLVGRFPSKHGVPDGYQTLKVTGAEISRVHLLFTVEAGALYVQDQNTSNGSTMIGVDRTIRSVPSGPGRLKMAAGDTVEFGDCAITFDRWL